jgi:hypothetical protein
MLTQNFKGFLTLIFSLSLVATAFYFYKSILEPGIVSKNSLEQFAVSTEEVEITPEIKVYSERATVSFTTPFETSSKIFYCTDKESTETCNNSVSSFGKNHDITVSKLTKNTKYFYKIIIDEIKYPLEELDFYNFETKGSTKTFEQALKEQDLSFDYNKDGKVTITDLKAR